MTNLESIDDLGFDTSEGDEPSAWEERFENQVNAFFDEAIARVPGFVDRYLRSFRQIMKRSIAPKTGLGDVLVSMRNMLSGVSESVGGPDFSRDTYTHEELTRAFERDVVSSEELETLLSRLFREFEQDQWEKIEDARSEVERRGDDVSQNRLTREHIEELMHKEIAHDPLLAQVIRSGVKIGLPATLGYVLFGKVTFAGGFGSEAAGSLYKRRLDLYNSALLRIGRFQVPGWVGAIGFAGGLVGTLAIGGLVEYAVNSLRDVKGAYIRQLNAARYALLYGEDPETPEGQGLVHLVRGLERQFDKLAGLSRGELEEARRTLEEQSDALETDTEADSES